MGEAERLLALLEERGITVTATGATGTGIAVRPASGLTGREVRGMRRLRPFVIAILTSRNHACPRCSLIRVGAAALRVDPAPLMEWLHPNKWVPWIKDIRPAKDFGPRAEPMMIRDEGQRDPAVMPRVTEAIMAGAAELGITAERALGEIFKDLMAADPPSDNPRWDAPGAEKE
jgi:hypothetical protein